VREELGVLRTFYRMEGVGEGAQRWWAFQRRSDGPPLMARRRWGRFREMRGQGSAVIVPTRIHCGSVGRGRGAGEGDGAGESRWVATMGKDAAARGWSVGDSHKGPLKNRGKPIYFLKKQSTNRPKTRLR
jgi:hypothetical protein